MNNSNETVFLTIFFTYFPSSVSRPFHTAVPECLPLLRLRKKLLIVPVLHIALL